MLVKLVRQYTVFIRNQPGALCEFVNLFTKEDLNIVGITSEVREEASIVRVAIDAEKRVSPILTGAGYTTIETMIISYEVAEDGPGNLLWLSKTLGDSGINITNIYGTSCSAEVGRVLFTTSDNEKAIKVLRQAIDRMPRMR